MHAGDEKQRNQSLCPYASVMFLQFESVGQWLSLVSNTQDKIEVSLLSECNDVSVEDGPVVYPADAFDSRLRGD